jgi:hypothetical protein
MLPLFTADLKDRLVERHLIWPSACAECGGEVLTFDTDYASREDRLAEWRLKEPEGYPLFFAEGDDGAWFDSESFVLHPVDAATPWVAVGAAARFASRPPGS